MKNRRSVSAGDEMTDINISPLIDMVFILLIFFIVTTVFIEEPGVKVSKPVALSAARLERQCILIAVTDDARVIYGGKEIGIPGVRATIMRLLRRGDPMPIILQIDERAPAGTAIRVIDEAKLANAQNVFISTRTH